MGMRAGGWKSYINATDEKPRVTWELLKRVMGYSSPYRREILVMLVLILITTGMSLLTPLILRDLIDRTIPSGNVRRLAGLASALLLLPVVASMINVLQRRLNSRVSEGVIYDLRLALYTRLQRMSLRFFTNTKVGELMSRLNNDVVGAQNAISNTILNMITNIIQAAAVMFLMLALEWRLTLISLMILPLFILLARRLGGTLRGLARQEMEANASMNAMMNETLNIGGALLVKLFGRRKEEINRFKQRAAGVRDLGTERTVWRTVFVATIGLLTAVGTAVVYGIGGYLVMQEVFTVGMIVAFGAYLNTLYGALQQLANAPVDFATSLVSFERVFEIIDLPAEIDDKPGAAVLEHVKGELVFEDVTFKYEPDGGNLLSEVNRPGKMDQVTAALSGTAALRGANQQRGANEQRGAIEQRGASRRRAYSRDPSTGLL